MNAGPRAKPMNTPNPSVSTAMAPADRGAGNRRSEGCRCAGRPWAAACGARSPQGPDSLAAVEAVTLVLCPADRRTLRTRGRRSPHRRLRLAASARRPGRAGVRAAARTASSAGVGTQRSAWGRRILPLVGGGHPLLPAHRLQRHQVGAALPAVDRAPGACSAPQAGQLPPAPAPSRWSNRSTSPSSASTAWSFAAGGGTTSSRKWSRLAIS